MQFKLTAFKKNTDKWSIILLTIILFISLPLLSLLWNLIEGPGESWGHMVRTILPGYLSNTLLLIAGTVVLTALFGVIPAWLVSRYDLYVQRSLTWLLIMPLAIPSYITAYAYAGILDYGGIVHLVTETKVDVMNIWGLIFVLSVSLYPYVYVACRAFFMNQSSAILEASKLLGASEWKSFLKLILPLSRPAAFGGLLLVLMEVLNDYGAAKYYGVNTLTTGIFRAWFSLEEPETAIYLSAILVAIIFVLILLEKKQRARIGYANAVKSSHKLTKRKTSGLRKLGSTFLAVVPVVVGFIVPVLQLLYWAYLSIDEEAMGKLFATALGSLAVAGVAALATLLVALSLLFLSQWNKLPLVGRLSRVATIGYAIPGAVIAVGVLLPTLVFDKWLIHSFQWLFDVKIGLLLNGGIGVLLYAYVVRFLAVAYNPVEASELKLGKSLSESSYLLGAGKLRTLREIVFPLMKPALLSAYILVFVDVLKELPLTLILKPYKIETLAVKAYEYASDELIVESALPALMIVVIGIIPIVFLNRLISKNE